MNVLVAALHLGIVVGYFLFGAGLMLRMRSTHESVRGWGMLFFVTCALTHIDLAAHALIGVISIEDVLEPFHVSIHVIQVIAVWGFARALYMAFIVRGESARRSSGSSTSPCRCVSDAGAGR